MLLFTIPVSIVRSLEKIMRDFLWPNNGATKGLHWFNKGVFVAGNIKEA